jgi:hypothetical protein
MIRERTDTKKSIEEIKVTLKQLKEEEKLLPIKVCWRNINTYYHRKIFIINGTKQNALEW